MGTKIELFNSSEDWQASSVDNQPGAPIRVAINSQLESEIRAVHPGDQMMGVKVEDAARARADLPLAE